MWAGVGRALLYGFTALGVADIFGLGKDKNNGGLGLWGNPIVIIALIVLLLIVMKNMQKLKLT